MENLGETSARTWEFWYVVIVVFLKWQEKGTLFSESY